ncbi:MAG: type ISP restriction/modification enzyme, partial [Acidobacteriota bacterium]
PEPVVDFIVRAVDDVLKTEFNLRDGLADTSKTTITLDTQTKDKRSPSGYKQIEKEVHKVQILDPATGTGTFLAAIVKHIYKQLEGQRGSWNSYVEHDLIPRLNGFELLMASYTVAHLKLDMLLTETGYAAKENQRFKIYLTNALEEHHPDTGTLFANWLSHEANEANHIKRNTPVMCVIGNPPYSGISQNNSKWISNLIDDYKYVDGEHFGERKHWLNDDYVKFLRFGEHFVEKNGEGVLAFINNHSFIDNPTFRGMRWHMLNSFDKIYILNLHGNALKKEVSPDGSPDKNVFDIQAGVSINIFVKTGKKKKGALAEVKYFELWGERENKYQSLWENDLNSFDFKGVDYTKPYYFFQPKNETGKSEYEHGFRIDELFPNNKTGIVTMGDGFIIAETKAELKERLKDFLENDYTEEQLKNKYILGKNYAEWLLSNKKSIKVKEEEYAEIDYRPFDIKWTVFDNKLIWRWRLETMRHFLVGENVGLVIPKINKEDNCFFITKHIMAHKLCSAYDSNSSFPLYLYPETGAQQTLHQSAARVPNLNADIIEKIAERINLTFTDEKEETSGTFAPVDVLDYIYAVLHSPRYREKYKEFLKIDFPRVPYPTDAATFWQLANLGGELRQIHLLESPVVEQFITTYPNSGDNIVTRKMTTASIGFELTDAANKTGKVWINDEQFFDQVPLTAWNFYIGGYQPAQKWLKDRNNRELSVADIRHYQKIIVALSETDRLMKEIDKIELD